jgi:LasA protease
MNPIVRKTVALLVLTGILLSACGTNLWGSYDPILTPTPTITKTVFSEPKPTLTGTALPRSNTSTATARPSATVIPTRMVTLGAPRATLIYSSQSGDSLEAVALHFDVKVADIASSVDLPTSGLLDPGTPLIIPNILANASTTPSQQIIPDCELVYSPSEQSFDIENYVNSAGGKLSTFSEAMGNGKISGADGVQRIAFGSSISPHILLALIQYYTGWVKGQPKVEVDGTYPLGYHDPLYPGLYQQLRLIVRELLAGYYGWRDGSLTSLTFPDGTSLRLAPSLNAGTVALQYMFSKHLNQEDWLQAIDKDSGFPALFASMFGDPQQIAQETGPLFPPDLTQPPLILPFEAGVPWTLTGGPHPAWEQESIWASLDFAPPMDATGCGESRDWVVAVTSGLIVRSGDGYVVLDLDGDGFEQTGWVVLYEHIATKDRIKVGTWVNAGDHIGHPSCEGGTATGTHVHIARKYNGEWVAAGDPLPFVLSGWTAHTGSAAYKGTLTKGDKVITASVVSSHEAQIIREPGE